MMVSYDDVERLLDYGRESRHMMVSYDDVERRLNVAVRQKNWSASSNVAGRQKNWSASSNVAGRQKNWSTSSNVAGWTERTCALWSSQQVAETLNL